MISGVLPVKLFLDLGGVYMGVFILDNSSGCTLTNYAFLHVLNVLFFFSK